MTKPNQCPFKGRDGKWRVDEQHELGNNLVLSITSFRRGDGTYVCNASVSKRDGIFMTHAVHQDYYRHLGIGRIRATEKNVLAFHRESLNDFGLDNVLAEARCHHREQLKEQATRHIHEAALGA